MKKSEKKPEKKSEKKFNERYDIAVLGGAGSMGRITVTDLCRTSDRSITVWIVDPATERAQALKSQLAIQLKKTPWRVERLRICKPEDLQKVDVLINCAHYQLNLSVMEQALKMRAHYVDLGGLFHVTRKQLEYHRAFLEHDLVAVIGVGAAPGITNLLARMGADELDQVTEIHCRVAGVDHTRYLNAPALPVSYSIKTIMEEFSKEPAVFSKGKFQFVEPMSGDVPHRFPKPIGLRRPMYTLHSEVATLPLSFASKGVREVSFKIAFDPQFTDRVRFLRDVGLASSQPLVLGGARVIPIDVVHQVIMSQPQGTQVGKLNQHEVVRTVVKGIRGKFKQTRVLDCTTSGMPQWGIGIDIDTGSPPAVCAQLLVENRVTARGVLAPEIALEPKEFFERLKRRGMLVTAQCKQGWDFQT